MAESDIRLNRGEGQTAVRFANFEELREFLAEERSFFGSLRFNPDSTHIDPEVRTAARHLHNANHNAGIERTEQEHANAKDLAEAFLQGKWPHRGTIERQLLNSLNGLKPTGAKGDKEVMIAAFQLLYGSGDSGSSVSPIAEAIAGFAVAALSFGAAPNGKALFRDTSKAQQLENRRVLGELEADVAGAKSALEVQQNELTAKTDYLFERAQKRFDTFRRLRRVAARATRDEIEKVHATYREQMRLQEPVKYWAEKESAHGLAAGRWFKATAAAACAVLVVPIGLWIWLTWGQSSEASLLSTLFRSAPPSWTAILREAKSLTLVLLASGVTVWALRLSARVYLSERHLATDARERQTIVMTYLALLKESAATEAERTIVLQTLFRSSADGIVKDDSGMDPSIAGLLGKVVERFKP